MVLAERQKLFPHKVGFLSEGFLVRMSKRLEDVGAWSVSCRNNISYPYRNWIRSWKVIRMVRQRSCHSSRLSDVDSATRTQPCF